jgi:hypothetical protein
VPGTRRKPGRLGLYIEGFKQWLLASGYTPGTVVIILWEAGRLGRWMDGEDIDVGGLDVEVITAFLAALRAAGCAAFRACGASGRCWPCEARACSSILSRPARRLIC